MKFKFISIFTETKQTLFRRKSNRRNRIKWLYLFAKFRSGEIKCLVVSKVANFSIDLPEASIAIQVSGTFGSRQEEAQRLGRILRPKADGRGARFYSLVARDTIDQDFAQNRQRFLAEQGYAYRIIDADEILNKN
jgi:DNA excision repair protein ERCC-3